MITVTYQSPRYAPEAVVRRFAMVNSVGVIIWSDLGNRGFDLRQGYADPEDLPLAVLAETRARPGRWVAWPIDRESAE